jgi:hypothetical protein
MDVTGQHGADNVVNQVLQRKKVFSLREHTNYNLMWMLEHLFGKGQAGNKLESYKTKTRQHLLEKVAAQGNRREISIDRRKNLSPEEFKRQYLKPRIPVILEGGAKDWECCRRWSFDYFTENHGDEDCTVTSDGDPEAISLRETIERIKKGDARSARICNLLQNHPELHAQTNFEQLRLLTNFLSFETSYQLFVGGAGRSTALHAGSTHNFIIQIAGTKTWRIIDPNYNPVIQPIVDGGPLFRSYLNPCEDDPLYPEVQHIDLYRADLEPGDILFNPAFFWHYVTYNTDAIHIALRWFSPLSTMQSSPMLSLLLMCANNPSALTQFKRVRSGENMGFFR